MKDDLFDHAERLAESRRARDEGMERVEGGAVPEWSILMLELVRLTCLEQHLFTADHVFDRLESYPGAPSTPDSRAFGPVMMRAKKLGYCRGTGRVESSHRKTLHASPIAVWESLIHGRRT